MSEESDRPPAPTGFQWTTEGPLDTPHLVAEVGSGGQGDLSDKFVQARAQLWAAMQAFHAVRGQSDCEMCQSVLSMLEYYDFQTQIEGLRELKMMKEADGLDEMAEMDFPVITEVEEQMEQMEQGNVKN